MSGASIETRATRDRLLSALTAATSGGVARVVPMSIDDDLVVLADITTRVPIVVLALPDVVDDPVKDRLQALVAAHGAGLLVVGLVGGDAKDVARVVKEVTPFWQISRQFAFFAIVEGRCSNLYGPVPGWIKNAADLTNQVAEIRPEELARLAEERGKGQSEIARFAAATNKEVPVATLVLGSVCVIVFLLGQLWGRDAFQSVLWRMGADFGPLVRQGEYWRLLASVFLHANFIHLAVNMFALWSFGSFLERVLGRARLIILYAICGLCGSLASSMLSEVMSVGASGAIWGLMAAGMGLALVPRDLLPPALVAPMRQRMLRPLVINVLYSFSPGIDMLAHLGGGVAGLVLVASTILTRGRKPAWSADSQPTEPQPSSPLAMAAAVVCSLLMAASVGAAWTRGRPWELGSTPSTERVDVGKTGVSIELPASLARNKTSELTGNDIWIYSFGTFAGDPLVAEIIFNRLAKRVEPEALEGALVEEKTALESMQIEGWTRVGPATIETLAGRRVVTVRHTMDEIVIRSWASIFDDREVVLRVYTVPNVPAGWKGLDQRIAESLSAAAVP